MSEDRVSLIATVFNEASSVETLVRSVAAMDRLPDEFVVVDAGSTDGTAEILRTLGAEHPWLRLVVEPGCNIARGRNVAIGRASHALIAMVDAGCIVDRQWLAKLCAHLELHPEAGIIGGWTAVRPGNRFERWVSLLQVPVEAVDRSTFLPSARSALVRRSAWEAAGKFPEDLTLAGEDTLFMVRARDSGVVMLFEPEAVVTWQPQRSIGAYLRQYHRYGIGDGEAHLHAWLNLKLFILCLSPVALVAGLFVDYYLSLLALIVLVMSYGRIIAPLRPASVSPLQMIPAYGFFLLTQWFQVSGYIRGRLRPARRGAPPRIAACMFGGLDRVPPVLNEGMSLAGHGCRVDVLGLRYDMGQLVRETVAPGFRLRRLGLVSRKLFGDHDHFELIRYAEMAFRSFWWCFFANADLYVAHDLIALPYVYPAARLRGKPVVYRAHELWSEQKKDFPRAKFWRSLDRWFSARVDLIIVPEINRAHIYQDEYGAKCLPTVIFNCSKTVPRPLHSPLPQLLRDRGLDARFIAYFHGGISAERSLDAAVEAVAMLPADAVLVLVGSMERPFADWLAASPGAQLLGKRLVHLGAVPHGTPLFELCAGAHAGLAFTTGACRNNEYNVTATNKLFEYMMCAVPLVTSGFKGFREFVEGQEIGLCVDHASPAGIAAALRRMYDDPVAARSMGERGRVLAEERYNWDKVAPALVAAYGTLLGRDLG